MLPELINYHLHYDLPFHLSVESDLGQQAAARGDFYHVWLLKVRHWPGDQTQTCYKCPLKDRDWHSKIAACARTVLIEHREWLTKTH